MATTATLRRATPLTPADRKAAAGLLQAHLYALVDLRLAVQQVHWNVEGPRFYAIHTMTDTFYTALDGFVDVVAERIRALGSPADGRPAALAEHSPLPDVPAGTIQDEAALRLLLDLYRAFDEHLRDTIEGLDEPDPSSQDLLIDISRESEKHQWMIRAHLA